jgi:hypothetical protein
MFSRHAGVSVRPTLKGTGALQLVDGVVHPLVGGLTVGVLDRSGRDGVAFGEVTSRVVAFLGENHVIEVFGQTGALDLRLCPIREVLADAKLAEKVATVDGLDGDATNCGLVD